MIHHGDEQVQQHDNIDDRVRAKHQHSPEPRKDLDAVQIEAVQVDQSENGPEQSLGCLEQAVNGQKPIDYRIRAKQNQTHTTSRRRKL